MHLMRAARERQRSPSVLAREPKWPIDDRKRQLIAGRWCLVLVALRFKVHYVRTTYNAVPLVFIGFHCPSFGKHRAKYAQINSSNDWDTRTTQTQNTFSGFANPLNVFTRWLSLLPSAASCDTI